MTVLTEHTQDLIHQLTYLPDGLGTTYSVVVEQGGQVLAETYNGTLPLSGTVVEPTTPLLSWSMAKSITHLLLGIAHDEGLLDVDGVAPVPEWAADPSDQRQRIMMRQLLQMSSGLQWNEAYTLDAPSNVVEMLFGKGKQDVGAYAASMPLAGSTSTTGPSWMYSSGTTNILCRILETALRAHGTDTISFLNSRLLVPAGIAPVTEKTAKLDEVGTWIGSSFLYLPATDWARLGRLMLGGGVANGQRVISQRWIAEAQQPCSAPTNEEYGYSNHWWLWPTRSATPDAYAAFGYEGQHLIMVPSKDVVVVRLGSTPDDKTKWIRSMLHRLIESV
jgi:CubicO group peptidase (beta-lactamase class C family)